MPTIQVNAELIAAAKAYREAFLPTSPEEQEELNQLAKENEPNIFSHMGWLLYQLAEAIIRTETEI